VPAESSRQWADTVQCPAAENNPRQAEKIKTHHENSPPMLGKPWTGRYNTGRLFHFEAG
jgi:hypothetical protein